MTMVVKFGGTSVGDADRMRKAAQKVLALQREGWQVVAVVSAQGDTTDRMIACAASYATKACPREMDAYLSAGEQMSAALMAMTIQSLGGRAISLNGWQMGLMTDGDHANARFIGLPGERIRRELDRGNIVVATGFQGVDDRGDITTLGRGGSDTTAVALAGCLQAQQCRIYTDVDGVYDRDPRKFPDAKRYATIDYDHMMELARQGAQVLHNRCVALAKQYAVPIWVLSAFREGEGTWVGDLT